jgi:hypothetical protein
MEVRVTEEEGIQWVRGTIRAAMVKRRLTYADLAKRLKALGVEENERNLRNKVARGTFSAVFFVSCLEAMDTDLLSIDMHDQMDRPEEERIYAANTPHNPTRRETAAGEKAFLTQVGLIAEREFSSMKEWEAYCQRGLGGTEPADREGPEQTMDEILASIRKIISVDGESDKEG